ncbi:transporter substrate-binding domain-containing protein [Pseudodesulfovibrio sediminis]|nr:transporter substrate-binding domain-containing protein [Pseudodesulfovibrio sediminis]
MCKECLNRKLKHCFFSAYWIALFAGLLCLPFNALSQDDLIARYRIGGIVVAHEADMPPMSFVGHSGMPKGYLIDMWQKWSAETGIPVRFHLVDWADTIKEVQAGRADVHGGLILNQERDAILSFSKPLFPSRGVFLARKGSGVNDAEDLNGHLVGVVENSFYDNYIRLHYPEMRPYPFASVVKLAEAVSNGKVNAVLANYPTLMFQLGAKGIGKQFEVVQFYPPQMLRAAVLKGNDELLAVVQEGLERIDQRELDSLYNRWVVGEDGRSQSWLVPAVSICVISLILALIIPPIMVKIRP